MNHQHRMPFGAEIAPEGGVRFRLWAPDLERLWLRLDAAGHFTELEMSRAGEGWFERLVPGAGAGTRYRYRLPDGSLIPDPASRFQPDGVGGPSVVVDPARFDWSDSAWRGRPWEEAVLYELHVGTFTPGGHYRDVEEKLDHLIELGVTGLELMPLAQAPGGFGWGYDGVLPFAPNEVYGTPDELKHLVDAAHARGLEVLVDVVYNHFGPSGNHLGAYASPFFTDHYPTPWGAAIAFDGPSSRWVRELFVHNALYWIEEYRIDGLRFDAVHAIHDVSVRHVLGELAARARAAAGPARELHLVLENDDNAVRWLARAEDGRRPVAYDAQWNDDLHHALHAVVTGETEGYYADYAAQPVALLGRALTEGFVYQGQQSEHRGGARRGEPSGHLPPSAFVSFLQNHDQVGNRALGDRITALAPFEAVRAAVTVVLLAPSPPLLFMGEEWGARQPFPFFCDLGPELGPLVRDGRRREFASFAAFREERDRERIPDPCAAETFHSAILDWDDPPREPHRVWLAHYRRLLALRRTEIAPRLVGVRGAAGRFGTEGERGLSAEWRLADGSRLALRANLGARAQPLSSAPGKLLFCTHDVPSGKQGLSEAPPWYVAWTLGPPSSP